MTDAPLAGTNDHARLPRRERQRVGRRGTPRRPRACIVRQIDVYELMIQREAEALVEAGFDVEVICMRHQSRPLRTTINGVEVISLRSSRKRSGKTKARYALEYVWFFLLVSVVLAWRHLRRPYAVVQVNTMPDFLVFAAVVPKLFRARVLAYMHEPSPELAETIFGPGVIVRLLAFIEQRALAFADEAITVTPQLRQRYIERGADPERLTVVLNGVAPATMLGGWTPPATRATGHFTVVCHGSIEQRYGQDTIVEAAALLRGDIPELRIILTGRGTSVPSLTRTIAQLGLEGTVQYEGWVEPSRLNDILHTADVGVVAQKSSPYSELVQTNKMVDYWIFGLPVIASRLQAVAEMYDEDVIEYFEPGSALSLAMAIKRLYNDECRRVALSDGGRRAHAEHGWDVQRVTYIAVVDKLVPWRAPLGHGQRSAKDKPAPRYLSTDRSSDVA